MTISEWLDIGAIATGGAYALFCLFEGTRRLRVRGLHRSGVIMVVFGGIFCILWGGFEYWKHHMVTDVLKTVRRTVAAPIELNKNLSPEIRETIGHAHARSSFLESGTLTTYVDASGNQKLYVPAQDDIKQREERLVTTTKLEVSVRDSYIGALIWWLWALLAVTFGISFSRKEGAMPANSTVESDARKNAARGSP